MLPRLFSAAIALVEPQPTTNQVSQQTGTALPVDLISPELNKQQRTTTQEVITRIEIGMASFDLNFLGRVSFFSEQG